MADLASLANTNCPILSFSSRWTQRAANSQSDLLGVHDPQRKAQRTEPISPHLCPVDSSTTSGCSRGVSKLTLAPRLSVKDLTRSCENITSQAFRHFQSSGWLKAAKNKQHTQTQLKTFALCLHFGFDSGAHARKSPARFDVVISGRGGGLTNRRDGNSAQLKISSHALMNIVHTNYCLYDTNTACWGVHKYEFSDTRDVKTIQCFDWLTVKMVCYPSELKKHL